MGVRRTDFNTNDLINEYLSGKSVKQLASDHGFSRQVVYRVLREKNVHIRGRSESMVVRMGNMTEEERKKNALAANEAKRGSKNTPEMLHKRALAKKRRIGMFEQEFIDAITDSGIPVSPQEPFLSYNLDIGCGDIAVEIHTQTASPLHPHFAKKLMNCINAGKSMIYVWIDPQHIHLTGRCYEQVISILKQFRMNPPSRSQYWVVKGTGELYASGTFYSD